MLAGAPLTLTFNEPLNTGSVPASSAFTVKVAGAAVTLVGTNPVAVSGRTVVLTLANQVTDESLAVTVSYAVPGSNPIEDAGGMDAAAFTDRTASNIGPNELPTSADATVTTAEETDYTFTAANFAFADGDADDALTSVSVETLPAAGTLKLGTAAVTAGQSIAKTQIDAGQFVFEPAADGYGDAYTTFTFKVSDGESDSAGSYTMTIDVTGVDDPATGSPSISGMAIVGQTLTAAPGTVADVDGLADATYAYQWVRVDGGDQDISGAAAATYVLTASDEGKRVKVKASFEDDAGTAESRTSSAFPTSGTVEPVQVSTVAVTSSPAAASTYAAGETISVTATFNAAVTVTGTPRVALTVGSATRQAAYASGSDSAALVFSYTVAAGDNDADGVSWRANALGLNGGTIKVMSDDAAARVDASITHAAQAALGGHKVDTPPTVVSAVLAGAPLTLTFNEPLDAASVPASSAFTLKVAGAAVTLADTNPVAIAGRTVVLTLATEVTDATQTVTVSYAVPTGSPIQDAGGTDAAAFTDRAVDNTGGNELPTSADATVSTAEDTDVVFTAANFAFADDDAGEVLTSVTVETLPAAGTLKLAAAAVSAGASIPKSEIDAGRFVFEPVADGNGDPYATFTFKVNDGKSDSAEPYTMTIDVTPVDDAATGSPSISGTAIVGQTLTAAPGTVADADGLDDAMYAYQWVRVDGSDQAIAGANAATYVLVAADEGKRVKVKLSFDDDEGTAEARTSDPYPSSGTVEPVRPPGPPASLVASVGNARATLGWTAPASDGGAAVERYEYRYKTGGDYPDAWTPVADGTDAGTDAGDERRVVATGLANDTAHTFQVRAVNSAGGGGPATSARGDPAGQHGTDRQRGHCRSAAGWRHADRGHGRHPACERADADRLPLPVDPAGRRERDGDCGRDRENLHADVGGSGLESEGEGALHERRGTRRSSARARPSRRPARSSRWRVVRRPPMRAAPSSAGAALWAWGRARARAVMSRARTGRCPAPILRWGRTPMRSTASSWRRTARRCGCRCVARWRTATSRRWSFTSATTPLRCATRPTVRPITTTVGRTRAWTGRG